jgi:hypothetical protein
MTRLHQFNISLLLVVVAEGRLAGEAVVVALVAIVHLSLENPLAVEPRLNLYFWRL